MAASAGSIDFIRSRAQATRSAQDNLASTWVWEEKSVPQWDSDIADFEQAMQFTAQDDAARQTARASLDAALDTLHRRTMQALALAKVKYRNDPAKLALVENLTARGDSRTAIRDEALGLESAWNELDKTWTPLPANTFSAFQALRAQCAQLTDAYGDATAAWRSSAEKLNVKAAALDDSCVGWYAAATAVFPAGTPEGDMIRGTVPTTYSPPAAKPAPAPQPATPTPQTP